MQGIPGFSGYHASSMTGARDRRGLPLGLGWLFSPGEDLLAFAAPTAVALFITFALSATGRLGRPLGSLGWLLAVVLVDVAHVYATLYRVYADPAEVRRRPLLYLGLPALIYAAGVGLSAAGLFWTALAYLAVFHFIRQQYGWIALSGRRERDFTSLDRRLDAVAVYAGTLYPILYWHAHLPRSFVWFVQGDFLPGGSWLAAEGGLMAVLRVLWLGIGLLWLLRQGQRIATLRSVNAARILVMVTTWVSWYVGIVHYNSDVAFTVTNVLPHGIPYFVLLFRYRQSARQSGRQSPRGPGTAPSQAQPLALALLAFYLPLGLLAFVEEGVWDRLIWHDHAALYPGPALFVEPGLLLCLLVPLLALPQATHYLLDAWIWRSGPQNPDLRDRLGI